MRPDALGFLYPEVDKQKCVECGLCEKVCAFNESYDRSMNLPEPDVYAARHKDMAEIEKSRSGAMFIALSDWVLAHGGSVYGAGYVDHFRVAHKRATTAEQRDEFRGSKYVQSDMGDNFTKVADDLRSGSYVLFSGTPCQTSGLASYLRLRRIDISKLYLVDVVCHGVPAPYYWRDYLAYIERRQKEVVVAVNFRDKSRYGWAAHKESFTFQNGGTQSFSDTYYQDIMFRRSCGVCHFANIHRPSDITIADFWGWQRVDETFNVDDKGVSLVLVNTHKGQKLFDLVKSCMHYIPSDTQACLQLNLQRPTAVHPLRENYERDYVKHGFVYVMRHYSPGWRYRLKVLEWKFDNAKNVLFKR